MGLSQELQLTEQLMAAFLLETQKDAIRKTWRVDDRVETHALEQ